MAANGVCLLVRFYRPSPSDDKKRKEYKLTNTAVDEVSRPRTPMNPSFQYTIRVTVYQALMPLSKTSEWESFLDLNDR